MCTVKAHTLKTGQQQPNRLILVLGADPAPRPAAATANSFPERTLIPKRLTPREEQVLKFIVEGLTNKQIAREIQVSVKTVEKHRQEIMNKLRIHHTAGLTCYALANGICFPKTISASMARRVPSSRGNCSTPVDEAGHDRAITRRERQVLRLIAEGMLNKQIAAELNLSVKTVVNHRQEVMKRLNIHHIAGLTRYALSNGLLDPNETGSSNETPAN